MVTNMTVQRKSRMTHTLFRIFVYTAAALCAVICMIPLYWVFRSSIMKNTEVFIFPPRFFPAVAQWGNYQKALSAFPLWLYLKNTMMILIPCVAGTVITSMMCGYAFAKISFPLKNFWFALVILAMLLPSHVTLIPTYLTWSKIGLTNTYWPFYVGAWAGGQSFNIYLMRQFIRTIPKEYDEAAIIDGANRLQILLNVVIPLIIPVIITVCLFSFTGYWNDFFGPLIYLHTESKYTIALGLLTYKNQYNVKWNLLMAASLLVVTPPRLLFAFGQKYFVKGIVLTGIKG